METSQLGLTGKVFLLLVIPLATAPTVMNNMRALEGLSQLRLVEALRSMSFLQE
jgi:hypothetical protein